jgi:hypothetical protein
VNFDQRELTEARSVYACAQTSRPTAQPKASPPDGATVRADRLHGRYDMAFNGFSAELIRIHPDLVKSFNLPTASL